MGHDEVRAEWATPMPTVLSTGWHGGSHDGGDEGAQMPPPAAIHGVTPRSVTETPRRYMNFLGECYRGKSSEYFVAGDRPIAGFWPAMKRIWKQVKAKPAAAP